MATLQKIRNRAGLLVAIIIGFALFAFILGDLFRSGSSLLKGSQMEIADINGNSVDYKDFQRQVDQTTQIYKMNSGKNQVNDQVRHQIQEQVWQDFVHKSVMNDVYDDLGLAVSSDELFDMVQGKNIHPIIRQLFTNPKTGQLDRSAILRFLKSLDTNASPEQKAYWLYIENQITKERLLDKYNTLVAKGLYVTKTQAQESLQEQNKTVNIQYVGLAYNSIPDSAVKVTDSELQDYYNKHQQDYQQEGSRTINYINFPVVASADDDAKTLTWINDIKDDFAKASNDKEFVNANSDVPFDDTFNREADLSGDISDFAFHGKIGDIYGPYKDDHAYKLIKIDSIGNLPDSVRASHILIKPATAGSYAKAVALADSLKNLLENHKASFSALAKKYSEDPGSAANGGDLGWFKRHQMVKAFEDAAFSGKVNHIYQVTTQFGVHLIMPTDMGKKEKQVRLATLTRNIEPSNQTYQKVYAQASKFAGENQSGDAFDQAIRKEKLNKQIVTVTKDETAVPALPDSRSVIRAAYSAENNHILENSEGSSIFELGDNFVIAKLAKITEKGTAPFAEVKARVELAVQKQNKGKLLASKLKSARKGDDLTAAATALNTPVKDADGINFSMYSIPQLGVEPAVIGTVTNMPENKVSKPIIGNDGVFLTEVISAVQGTDSNVEQEQLKLIQALSYRAAYQAFDIHKKAVKIEDNRAKFY